MSFLTPAGRATPESPLACVARRDGGTLGIRDGWLLPTRFTSIEQERAALGDTVGWGDVSPMGKFEVHSPTGVAPGSARLEGGRWWCPVTPMLTLVLGAAAPGERMLDVTAQYAALVIAGPLGRETITRFCALDLRAAGPGAFLPGSLARTPGYLLSEAENCFLLLFGAAFSEYMWTVVSDAGRGLGGRPVGWDALATVRPRGVTTEAARA